MAQNISSSASLPSQDRPQRGAWRVTFLLLLFMLINFSDKIVVGLAAAPIMAELGLSHQEFGLLSTAFFFLFPASAVLVGFLSRRFQTKSVLLVLAVLWSVLQFPMLGAVSLEVLIICRLLLGAAEGPAQPLTLHATYKWFPDALRALPTAVIAQGSALGVILAVPVLNWIIVHHSWHWAFGAVGAAGLLWVLTWLILGEEGKLGSRTTSIADAVEEKVPLRYLFTCPSIIAVCCAGFASYWGLALGLTWFTDYLVSGLGYSQTVGGNLTILPWIAGMLAVLGGGVLLQRLKKAGVSSRFSRGILPCTGLVLGGLILLPLSHVISPSVKIGFLVAGTAIGSVIYIAIPMIVSELTPDSQRSAVLAIITAINSTAGVMAPLVMGAVVQNATSPLAGYDSGYAILGCILLAGGIIGLIFIQPELDATRLSKLRVIVPVTT